MREIYYYWECFERKFKMVSDSQRNPYVQIRLLPASQHKGRDSVNHSGLGARK